MNMQNNLSKQHQDTLISRRNFFRELEIEFLLHELKDPLSIIETGMRSLLEKPEKYGGVVSSAGKNLATHAAQYEKSQRDAQWIIGNRAFRSRTFCLLPISTGKALVCRSYGCSGNKRME